MPPRVEQHPVFKRSTGLVLPQELVDNLNTVYLMHRLATEPEKTLPPGQTLLSMANQVQMERDKAKEKSPESLLERVQDVAQKAFWDEVNEALSSPLPSVQLKRLKLLYNDLHEAVRRILPDDHKVVQTLRAHLAPTTSPLVSTLIVLKEVLLALRGQCAPVRDAAIDRLFSNLDEWRTGNSASLPHLIANTFRETISLAEIMTQDLGTATMGLVGEDRMKPFIVAMAKKNERQVILDLWASEKQLPKDRAIREQWKSWNDQVLALTGSPFEEVPAERKWIVRLMKQLTANVGVSCPWPKPLAQTHLPLPQDGSAEPSNSLPPQFFFVTPKLNYIQNYMQAITIAAALRPLARLPIPPSPSSHTSASPDSQGQDFMARVWALLKSEINPNTDSLTSDVGSTKLINLSDEVIRARRLSTATGEVSAEEEKRLRDAVERILRPEDPVFQLLHRRLRDALTQQVIRVVSGAVALPEHNMPGSMKTGRVTDTKTSRLEEIRRSLVVPDPGVPTILSRVKSATATAVKGFEEPILAVAVEDVLRELLQSVTWIEYVWGDMM